ncbi:MAG TPA: hypothetical protein PKM73_21450 [Verrucomicrobiota bacterium]|nr:hypothetical protein [Verrucomicrobiota bacterium]HNU53166.1 hypothetical protein [Verrucomicrobiota bacterium]
MAILHPPINRPKPFAEQIGDDVPPTGTFVATVIDIQDEFNVERPKYQSTETERVDLTAFLFGFRDAQGRPHRIASRPMRISGHEKSALFSFLKSLLGRAPSFNWDYSTLKGAQCLVTVEHVQRRDGNGVFPVIAALSPLPAAFADQPAAKPAPPTPPASRPAPTPHAAAPPKPTPPPVPAPAVETTDGDIPF